jgi:hypothetical protein
MSNHSAEAIVRWEPQGTSEILIRATPERIWALLEDSTRLSEWATLVKRTTGTLEVLGAVRECDVELDGKPGRVVERCVEYDRLRRIGWLMVGLTRILPAGLRRRLRFRSGADRARRNPRVEHDVLPAEGSGSHEESRRCVSP